MSCMKTDQILEKLTIVPLYVAAVLLPSFFLPITTEWLEWNKYYLLGILVVISLLAWLGRGLVTKKLVFVRSPLDIPFLALWVVMLVSSILAKDRIVAFFGPADNVSWSFLALTFYLLAAFLVRSSVRGERELGRFLELLGIGVGLTALYFWLGRINLLGWLEGPRSNPAAGLNLSFGVLQVLLFILALGALLQTKLERSRMILWGALAALAFITITALGFPKIWLIATVGLFILLVLAIPRLGQVRYPIVSVAMVAFVLALVFWILGTPKFLTVSTGLEVTLAQGRSLQITADTLREGVKPLLFGSGPGTFVYDFSAHRSETFNDNIFWSTRFSRPGASSYQILAETGALGALAAIVLFLVGLGSVLQMWSKKRLGGVTSELGTPLAAAWITSLVALFFVNYGTTLWFTFFTLLTLLVLAGAQAGAVREREAVLSLKTTPQYALATSFMYIVVIALVVVGGIFLGRFYGADVLAGKAAEVRTVSKFEESEALLARAMTLDPYRARYALGLANTYLRHAEALSRGSSPDRERIGALVANAINASRKATTLAPLSVASWEQLATIYANARVFAKEANEWVINALGEAIRLESTNPRLYAQRGITYRLIEGKGAEAKADFERAVELKADYAPAHYQLSVLFEQGNELDAAIQSAARAAQIASRDINAQFNLARLLYNRNGEGDWDAAERLYRRSLTINKDHANTLYALGVLLERKGEYVEAANTYERVLELDPNAVVVRERLNNLPEGTPRKVNPEPVEEGEVTDLEAEEAAGE